VIVQPNCFEHCEYSLRRSRWNGKIASVANVESKVFWPSLRKEGEGMIVRGRFQR
jgi:hypothetical protein